MRQVLLSARRVADQKDKNIVTVFTMKDSIPDVPERVSDFPLGTIHPTNQYGTTQCPGKVTVVTVDGQKFHVIDDRADPDFAKKRRKSTATEDRRVMARREAGSEVGSGVLIKS
jgi:hypothetical protein